MKNYYLLIVTVLTVFSFGCQKAEMKEQAAKPVKVKEVETFESQKGNRYSASIRPNTQVVVGFKVGGYVERITTVTDVNGMRRSLQAGDIVRQGQVLAQLRRSDYQTKVNQAEAQKGEVQKNVNTTKAQFNEMESSVSINRSQVAEAETSLEQAKIDFNRAQNLYNAQSMTKKDFDNAKTNLEIAERRVNTARASLKTAQEKVKTMQSQIDQVQAKIKTTDVAIEEAKIPLQDTTLRAPFTAVILERKVEAGSLVAPNASAFVLADTTLVKAVFGVPDIELQTLKLGQVLALTTEVLPNQEFSGRVSRIAPSADQNSRVFEVEVTIPNLQNLLKSGMIASLEMMSKKTGEANNVVPLSAVVRSKNDANNYAVFVAQEINSVQIVHSREVVLGETYGNTVAVTKGVQKGEKVVISGATFLDDGEKVQIIP